MVVSCGISPVAYYFVSSCMTIFPSVNWLLSDFTYFVLCLEVIIFEFFYQVSMLGIVQACYLQG